MMAPRPGAQQAENSRRQPFRFPPAGPGGRSGAAPEGVLTGSHAA